MFDLTVARTGIGQRDAETAGFQPATVDSTFDDHKAYYPGATPMRVRVTADLREGRLLGAQLSGHTNAQIAKRVDIYAAAIHHRMALEQLNDLDLSYTPPYSSPWDPVQMSAQAWQRSQRTAAATAS